MTLASDITKGEENPDRTLNTVRGGNALGQHGLPTCGESKTGTRHDKRWCTMRGLENRSCPFFEPILQTTRGRWCWSRTAIPALLQTGHFQSLHPTVIQFSISCAFVRLLGCISAGWPCVCMLVHTV